MVLAIPGYMSSHSWVCPLPATWQLEDWSNREQERKRNIEREGQTLRAKSWPILYKSRLWNWRVCGWVHKQQTTRQWQKKLQRGDTYSNISPHAHNTYHARAHTHTYTHICTRAHSHTRTHTHTHTHIHTHIKHTCTTHLFETHTSAASSSPLSKTTPVTRCLPFPWAAVVVTRTTLHDVRMFTPSSTATSARACLIWSNKMSWSGLVSRKTALDTTAVRVKWLWLCT
jgi:hypothetical protein